jgi:hypothetical protein
MSFSKNTEQEGKTGPVWRLAPVGGGWVIKKGCRRVNVVEILALMYENEKMRPAETIPGMGGEGDKGE